MRRFKNIVLVVCAASCFGCGLFSSGDTEMAALKGATEAAIEKSFKDVEARHFDTTSAGALWESVKQNPFEAAFMPGSLAIVMGALIARYKRKAGVAMDGLTAAVDAVESLPPEAATAFKRAAAASPTMNAKAAGLIAEIKAR